MDTFLISVINFLCISYLTSSSKFVSLHCPAVDLLWYPADFRLTTGKTLTEDN